MSRAHPSRERISTPTPEPTLLSRSHRDAHAEPLTPEPLTPEPPASRDAQYVPRRTVHPPRTVHPTSCVQRSVRPVPCIPRHASHAVRPALCVSRHARIALGPSLNGEQSRPRQAARDEPLKPSRLQRRGSRPRRAACAVRPAPCCASYRYAVNRCLHTGRKRPLGCDEPPTPSHLRRRRSIFRTAEQQGAPQRATAVGRRSL